MSFITNLFKKEKETERLTPDEAFQLIKEQQEEIDEGNLVKYFNNVLSIAESMKRAGQTEGLRRLAFLAKTTVKEAELIKRGYKKIIWKRDLDEILEPSDTTVKICSLKDFTRTLPEKAIKIIEDTTDLFTDFFIMFNDYTGKETKRRKQIEKNKDPILFGAFIEENGNDIDFGERMYPLYSWKDKYCDLTLDELCSQYKEEYGEKLVHTLSIPKNVKEVEERFQEFSKAKEESQDEDE